MPPNPLLVFCIISVSLVGAGLAYGDVRDDIANTKTQIEKIETQIEKLDKQILSQKNIIVGKENAITNAKENEKAWRAALGDSWQSQVEWEKAKKKLSDAEKSLKDAEQELQNLLNQRNNLIVRIGELEDKIEVLGIPKKRAEPGVLYGISLDNTCLTMLKNNITSACPSYGEISLAFPDIGCPFDGKKCLDYHKQAGSGKGYIIDPNLEIRERIPVIEIRSDFKEFHLKGIEGYNKTSHTMSYGLGRFVDAKCNNAYIDASQWLTLLGDSIMYLDSDCEKTFYNSARTERMEKIQHDITTSYKFQLEKWQKESLLKCGGKVCLYEKNQTAPP